MRPPSHPTLYPTLAARMSGVSARMSGVSRRVRSAHGVAPALLGLVEAGVGPLDHGFER